MKKLSLKAECYVTITGKGFFTQSQVLLFPIEVNYRLMALKTYNKNWASNLLLPPFGIVDDVLHNADTSKFSIRTCWPRVQSDLFWLRFLHIFRRCKKQFSKDKRPSGSNKIIRRQTIKNASSLSLPSLRFLTVPVRPRNFICFSAFKTRDEALAIVFDILLKMCILFPKRRQNHSFSCRRNIQYKRFFYTPRFFRSVFPILVTLNSFSFVNFSSSNT